MRPIERTRPASMTALLLLIALVATPALAAEPESTHRVEFEFGLGFDTNPTLAPSRPYFDQNSESTVTPLVQGSLYAPLSLLGRHVAPYGVGRNAFVTEYDARGNFFVESFANSADETFARFKPGLRFGLAEPGGAERHVTLAPFVSYNKELYFDRDTGFEATSSGQDVSDRYTYMAIGGEAALAFEVAKQVDLELSGLYEGRDYETVPGLEAFDHDRLRGSAGVGLRLSRHLRLGLEYGYQKRTYGERHARSLDGESDASNPLLAYGYAESGATLTLKPTRAWSIEARAKTTAREDLHEGYNDYDQRSLRLRTTVRTQRAKLRASFQAFEREFDRAFIFDEEFDPRDGSPNPLKHYDGTDAELTAEWIFPRVWRLVVSLRRTEQTAADPRLDHERDQVSFALVFAP